MRSLSLEQTTCMALSNPYVLCLGFPLFSCHLQTNNPVSSSAVKFNKQTSGYFAR